MASVSLSRESFIDAVEKALLGDHRTLFLGVFHPKADLRVVF